MDINNNLSVDGSVTASGKLGGGVQASSKGDAVLLGSDGKVPSSLQATDMTLSLDADTKILTVTVNGVSETVDLSGIGCGMKQVIKSYTSYSGLYSDLSAGNIPAGAELIITGVENSSSRTTSLCIKYSGSTDIESPCVGGGVANYIAAYVLFSKSNIEIRTTSSGIIHCYNVSSAKVIYWE